jgi:hypothetical protein
MVRSMTDVLYYHYCLEIRKSSRVQTIISDFQSVRLGQFETDLLHASRSIGPFSDSHITVCHLLYLFHSGLFIDRPLYAPQGFQCQWQ